MSPVPRSGRNVALLLGIALMLTLSVAFAAAQENTAATGNETAGGNATANETANETPTGGASAGELGIPADAPAAASGRITRVLTLGVIEEGECPGGLTPPCFDTITFAANPGDAVILHGDFRNSPANPHNLHQTLPEPGPSTTLAPGRLHTISFAMPEDGNVRVVCDAHATTMILDIVPPLEAGASGGHGASVPSLGVHFLAYWVGVIAFALLFVVYGATFFLFKYNETPAATDHWDRSEAVPENKRLAPFASLLAVVLAIAVIAAVIFVALR